MSHRKLAEMLGFSSPAYTYWSRGGGIAADALMRACCWLDVDPRSFARGADLAELRADARKRRRELARSHPSR